MINSESNIYNNENQFINVSNGIDDYQLFELPEQQKLTIQTEILNNIK